MCRKPTRSEIALGKRLREHSVPFEFQVIISPYIVDFLLPDRMLVIEVDGTSHKHREEYDRRRTAYLQGQGLHVIRVPNSQASNVRMETIEQYPTFAGARRRTGT